MVIQRQIQNHPLFVEIPLTILLFISNVLVSITTSYMYVLVEKVIILAHLQPPK